MDKAAGQKPDKAPENSPASSSAKNSPARNLPDQSPQRAKGIVENNRQLRRKIFDFYTLIELSRSFNTVLDIKSLLEIFLQTLRSQLGVASAAIFLKKEYQSNSLIVSSYLGSAAATVKDQTLSEDSPVISLLIKSDSPVPVEALVEDSNDENELRILKQFQGGFVIPLVNRNRLNGVLLVGNRQDKGVLNEEDREFLAILAGQISVALENARLYEAEKNAIAELQATQEQLVHTERLAALGEISAKIAHEINNPLGIIKNYLMLINKSRHKPDEAARYVEIVEQEIDRITGIVRELLSYYRPQNIDFKTINVLNVLEEVINFLTPQLNLQHIEFTRQFAPDCPLVEASAENLKQVFINVIMNAIDAMPDGGTLQIAAENNDGQLLLTFCDSGMGVPEELIRAIFEPFFTTKAEGKGTGLGLSVCFEIIEKHKGTITYKNGEKGGCIEIVLPAVGETDG